MENQRNTAEHSKVLRRLCQVCHNDAVILCNMFIVMLLHCSRCVCVCLRARVWSVRSVRTWAHKQTAAETISLFSIKTRQNPALLGGGHHLTHTVGHSVPICVYYCKLLRFFLTKRIALCCFFYVFMFNVLYGIKTLHALGYFWHVHLKCYQIKSL